MAPEFTTTSSLIFGASQSASSSNPMQALNSSLLSGKFSDLTIIHGPRKWKAHKVVVASQSPVLEEMIEQLQDTAVLHLTSYDPAAVDLMMEYLYTSTYEFPATSPDFSLPIHIKVFDLASTLSIPGLQALSCNFFKYYLENHVTDLTVFFSSVREIYTYTTYDNSELRVAVVEAQISTMRSMLENEAVREGFHAVTAQFPEFQVGIYRKLTLIVGGEADMTQTDILTVLIDNPNRVIDQVLCDQCGPKNDEEGYTVMKNCEGCGAERTLTFF